MSVARHSLGAVSALAAAPLAGVALALRPDWRAGLGERLGALPPLEPGSIWLHGASVGESRLVVRLAAALEERGRRVFASAQTTTGRAVLAAARPSKPLGLAPIDHPFCVDRALARVAPAAIVLCETEIWPCWIAAATRRGVPMGIVSGRISDRSFDRYRWVAPWIQRALARLDRVGARTGRDAERFVALGARSDRVSVTGDLKWAPPLESSAVADDLRAALAGRPILVAGSTHAGEEGAVLAALELVERAGHAPILVVAPRHPERLDAVEAQLRAAGRSVRRRTRLGEAGWAPGEILLLDTLGELAGVYGLARGAFVGGSLVEAGGHDPIEAVRQGCPVAIGPHHANVQETVALLVDAGAARRLTSAEELGAWWQSVLSDAEGNARVDAAVLLAPGGAVLDRSVALVEQLMDRSPE